jgi:hypothetical protein
MKKYTRFSARMSLAVIGKEIESKDIWGEIERNVHIAQKIIKYRPIDKLKTAFINIIAGGEGLVEINRLVRTDKAIQKAFGQDACAEQSTVSETINACTAENVEEMKKALITIYRKNSQGYRHDYTKDLQVLDIDMTGLLAGKQGEEATRGYFSGAKKDQRGRQLGRVFATKYDEIVLEKLYPGTVQLDQNFQELALGAEMVLELDQNRRKQCVIRVDGGGGKDADINWMLLRGYYIIVKVKNWKRSKKLAETVQEWHPDPKEYGREFGWVGTPHEYEGTTRQVAIRSKKGDKWNYRILVCNLPDKMIFELAHMECPSTPSDTVIMEAILRAYDMRGGGVETANKGSKQGLGLNKRNKRKFAAQEMLTCLAQLAFNLMIWFRSSLCQLNPAFAKFGMLRMIKDIFQISGSIRLDNKGQITSIHLNNVHKNAIWVYKTWRLLFASYDTPLILDKF